jgi:hypothetical protein
VIASAASVRPECPQVTRVTIAITSDVAKPTVNACRAARHWSDAQRAAYGRAPRIPLLRLKEFRAHPAAAATRREADAAPVR